MSDSPVDMKGVELMAEGTWNGIPFTDSDLDSMVSSFDTLGLAGRVPLKMGHTGPDARDAHNGLGPVDPLDQLAMGWVTKVYREGKKLLSDWEVPPEVASLIKKGYLRHISVELLKDVQAGTRVIPWVLDAVALLGSDQPAVGILKNLKELALRRYEATQLSHVARASFSRAESTINFQHVGDASAMSDGIKELAEKIGAMQVQINEALAENARLKSENTTLKGVESKFTVLQTTVKQNEVKAHRKTITDRFETAVKSDDIQPRVREQFTRVNGVDDDDQVLRVSLEDVEAYIAANPNPYKKRKETGKVVSLARSSDDVPPGTAIEEELKMRVEASLREDKIDNPTSEQWQRATTRLFKSNPDFGIRYRNAVNVAIAHPSARAQ